MPNGHVLQVRPYLFHFLHPTKVLSAVISRDPALGGPQRGNEEGACTKAPGLRTHGCFRVERPRPEGEWSEWLALWLGLVPWQDTRRCSSSYPRRQPRQEARLRRLRRRGRQLPWLEQVLLPRGFASCPSGDQRGDRRRQ